MWSKHRLGDPIVCNRGTCGGKSYSSTSSFRQHIRTIHQWQYKFNCRRCDYGTDNYDCLTSHRVKKHKEKVTTPKGKLIVYACKKCKKAFDVPHLSRKHEINESCTRKKTIPCLDCTRFYKTKEGLAYHQEQQHKGKKSPCSTCGKMVSEKAMPNHQKQHSSERAVQRAKDFVAKLITETQTDSVYTHYKFQAGTIKTLKQKFNNKPFSCAYFRHVCLSVWTKNDVKFVEIKWW